MGFFIRKSWSFGPLRLNLSKGGVGVSFGFRGFRIGLNRYGPYLHVGWGGLYYRTSLRGVMTEVGRDDP